jgi:hypothetical protein
MDTRRSDETDVLKVGQQSPVLLKHKGRQEVKVIREVRKNKYERKL